MGVGKVALAREGMLEHPSLDLCPELLSPVNQCMHGDNDQALLACSMATYAGFLCQCNGEVTSFQRVKGGVSSAAKMQPT